jgi:flavin reductase (DIM6/NTAB) family NADH-FMN oxidoreductase RutF
LKEKKGNINFQSAYRLLYPGHIVLVTCIDKKGKPNIITLAWTMPTSFNPPLIAISIAHKRHSHTLIQENKEIVINIPTINLLKETLICGRTSGKDQDKFKKTGLTPIPAKKVKPPIIKECIAHLECKIIKQTTTGDHTIFIGKIIEAYANKGVFTEKYNLKKAKRIFYIHDNDFITLNPKIYTPKLKEET